jgi:hypothetical protein
MTGTTAPATAAEISTVGKSIDGAHCSHRGSMAYHEGTKKHEDHEE